MKIKELINYGKKVLNENKIEDSNIIARNLAEYILQIDRSQIIANDEKQVQEESKHRYYLALIEIIQGMPIQYITNTQEFMKINFYVDENVLIPQPDTETLVEEVIKISKDIGKKISILDMCTGSGCIGIALSKNVPNSYIAMTDKSEKALEIAKINCDKNLSDNKNIDIIKSDMFQNIKGKFDMIISNPPYIKSTKIKTLSKQVQKEPKIALDGGEDGLKFYKILVNEAYKFLNDGGYLCLEIGFDQKEEIINLIEQNGNYDEIYAKKDLAGNDRIIVANKKVL